MIKILPKGIMHLVALALTAMVGYIDWITGDYSVLIFYMIPVAVGAWFLGAWGSVITSLASGMARLASDFSTTINTKMLLWNSLEDTLFLFLVGMLIVYLKNVLEKEGRRWS